MPRMASRFVDELSEDEVQVLRFLMDHGSTPRERHRAHAIILSHERKTVNEIAEIFGVDRDTVTNWLNRWTKDGLDGLADKPRSGATPTLDESERQTALEFLEKYPNQSKRVLEELKKKTGKTISLSTLKRLARKAGLRWKRMRRSSKSKRDEQAFNEAQNDLATFQELHNQGDLDLYYFDESGFTLTPSVPYGWQKIGTTIEIPSQRSRQINTLGFLSYDGRTLFPYTLDCTVDTDCVISCMDDFSEQITNTTYVVLDNASPHSSKLFFEQLPRWEKKGLFIYFLPPYSPELNLIEILWRRIKYSWIPLSAYESFENLKDGLWSVLTSIGKEFKLNFT